MKNLQERLRNWGEWLCHDADIGPKPARCISIESTHIAELGDVHTDDICSEPIPNVADAERMNAIIQRLDYLERLCISLRYGGIPAVFRMRRIGESTMETLANNAEIKVHDALKKAA